MLYWACRKEKDEPVKSIKPGRGPSAMSGIGSVLAAAFGVVWMVLAGQIGAPPVFQLFGVAFIVGAVVEAVYSFMNAAGKNRFSTMDIVDAQEESDPLNLRFGPESQRPSFCSHCGRRLPADAKFCPGCGEKLKDE